MSRPRKLTDEEVDAVRSRWRLRRTVKQLAAEYDVSEATIKRAIHHDYESREGITDEEFARLVR